MQTRCVVVVDAAYVRSVAAKQLAPDRSEFVSLVAASELIDSLRNIAEELTGQDLLRVYWYERPSVQANVKELQRASYVCVRTDYVPGPESALSIDLSTLLSNAECGDVVVCGADVVLASALEAARLRARHVHLLQIGREQAEISSHVLGRSADTHRLWPIDVVATFFESTNSGAPVALQSTVVAAASGTASAMPRGTASASVHTTSHATSHAAAHDAVNETANATRHADVPAAVHGDHSTVHAPRPSPLRQEQSDYMTARLRQLTATRPVRAPYSARQNGVAAERTDGESQRTVGGGYGQHHHGTNGASPLADPSASPRHAAEFQSPHDVLSDDVQNRLRDIAEDILDDIELPDAFTLRTWTSGIPAHIDRQLLGASYSRLGVLLDVPQKSFLRSAFRTACARRGA